MADTCKTVRVVCAELAEYGGFKEINESDLAPGDVIWSEPAVPAPVKPPAPSTQASDEFSTMTMAEAREYLSSLSISFSKQLSLDAIRQRCRVAKESLSKE